MTDRILLVDDDRKLLRWLTLTLADEGFETVECESGGDALARAGEESLTAVVLDLGLPDRPGQDVLAELRERHPELPVVILSGDEDLDTAVKCMQAGASDFVQKPCEAVRLATSLRNALQRGELEGQVRELRSELEGRRGFAKILGSSEALRAAIQLLGRAATSDVTVLLQGESGTGKEVAARAVHEESARADQPFVAINCGAIPETLIESELFGHERGAFTGAVATRKGCFEQAEGGTLFLDEIGELRPDLQVRLLRVLQERQVQRVGSNAVRDVDVRLVAATNRDPQAEIGAGNLREDLYYRLAVFPVVLPPLRERDDDAALLAESFCKKFAARHGRPIRGLSKTAHAAIRAYGWPGNVRELENVVERAVLLEDGAVIALGSLPPHVAGDRVEESTPSEPSPPAEAPTVPNARIVEGTASARPFVAVPAEGEAILPYREQERRILLHALLATGWNVVETARCLEIGRATVYRKIERHGLSREVDSESRRAG